MVLAQREAQITRLSKTATGRTVLRLIGEAERKIEDGKTDVPRVWLNTTYSTPLPKNMNAERNQGRRRGRAKALNKFQANLDPIFHADAGPYPGRPGTFVIAVRNAKQDATATIKASNIDEAEEAAVALARIQAHRLQQKIATIITDSKTAILNMCRGRVGAAAAKLLGKTSPDQEARHTLTWVPGHSGHLGNEAAHSLIAQALNYRATRGEGLGLPTTQGDHSYGSSPYYTRSLNIRGSSQEIKISTEVVWYAKQEALQSSKVHLEKATIQKHAYPKNSKILAGSFLRTMRRM